MTSTRILEAPGATVEGEECLRCLDEAEALLRATPGVREVARDGNGSFKVDFDPDLVSAEELERRVAQAGEGASLEHRVLPIRGMDCPDCAATIEAAVRRLPGVRFASLNFGAQRLLLEFDPVRVALPTVERAVRRLGYRVPAPGETERERLFDLRHVEVRLAMVSGLLLLVGGSLYLLGQELVSAFLLVASAAAGSVTPGRRALGALRARKVDMNCLMVLAVIGALFLGEFAEAATVIFLFSVGEMLEGFAARRSRRAVKKLLEERPEVARVEREGHEVEVPAREVAVGEVVLVRPGEQIPLDGRVVAGRSAVNQAAVTGEAVPVDKSVGDEVFAGTMNEEGALEVEVTTPYDRTTLARVLQVVEQAQARKSDQQRFVDRFAAWYTPAVVAGAALVAALGPALTGQPFETWFYRALVLLVIACPCALVISTPVSVVSALTGALHQGILVKGGVYLERLARARAFALDKTGTLTRGSLRVHTVVALDGRSEQEVLALAASVEVGSEHPLGVAVVRHARERGLSFPKAEDFEALPGRGARARVQGRAVEVGRPEGLAGSAAARVEELRAGGETVVAVLEEGQPVGLVAFADAPRAEARQALDELRQMGQRLLLVTGDHPRAAQALARRLALEEVHAGLLPEDKLKVLRRLESDGFPVVMVGDGINDAPALAAATVGVSLGAAGTAVALETADVALMGDDLGGLPTALRLARRTRAVITQNIVLSLVTKVAFLGLALVGFANMWMAIAADMGASLLVTFNGLRLVGAPPKRKESCCESGPCGTAPKADPAPRKESCCNGGTCGGTSEVHHEHDGHGHDHSHPEHGHGC